MKKSVKILTGILGFFMLMPGLAKFTEPFKTFIYKHLTLIGFPFPDLMQYVVKFSEVGLGLALIYLAFQGEKLNLAFRKWAFNLTHLAVVVMMIVAIYTHLHPDVPAEILPLEEKPPYLAVLYLAIVAVNVYLNRKKP